MEIAFATWKGIFWKDNLLQNLVISERLYVPDELGCLTFPIKVAQAPVEPKFDHHSHEVYNAPAKLHIGGEDETRR